VKGEYRGFREALASCSPTLVRDFLKPGRAQSPWHKHSARLARVSRQGEDGRLSAPGEGYRYCRRLPRRLSRRGPFFPTCRPKSASLGDAPRHQHDARVNLSIARSSRHQKFRAELFPHANLTSRFTRRKTGRNHSHHHTRHTQWQKEHAQAAKRPTAPSSAPEYSVPQRRRAPSASTQNFSTPSTSRSLRRLTWTPPRTVSYNTLYTSVTLLTYAQLPPPTQPRRMTCPKVRSSSLLPYLAPCPIRPAQSWTLHVIAASCEISVSSSGCARTFVASPRKERSKLPLTRFHRIGRVRIIG
jgi:hypothetical protein